MRRHREAREREAAGGGEEAQRGDPVPQDHQPAAQGNGSGIKLLLSGRVTGEVRTSCFSSKHLLCLAGSARRHHHTKEINCCGSCPLAANTGQGCGSFNAGDAAGLRAEKLTATSISQLHWSSKKLTLPRTRIFSLLQC